MSAANPESETISRPKPSRTGLYAAIAVVIIVILIVAAGAYAGWFNAKKSSAGTSGCTPPAPATLLGAGSTLVYPLMYKWSTTYSASTVDYSGIGSGGGISEITAKSVDFGASDAPLNPAQRGAAPGLLTIPESAGAVVPIYNLPGIGKLNFNGTVLADIYLGTITTWNDPAIAAINPGVALPNATIVPVYRSDGSGTTFIWTEFLSHASPTFASRVGYATSVTFPVGVGSKGNSGVTQTVTSTADSIGYVDINYALTNGVSYGKVENPSGAYILASVNNTASAIADANPTLPAATGDWYNVSVLNAPGAGDYPIASLTYVLVYQNLSAAYGSGMTLSTAENLVNFLTWIVTTGQNYSGALYYVPLPKTVTAFDLAAIASMTFNGAAVPACGT